MGSVAGGITGGLTKGLGITGDAGRVFGSIGGPVAGAGDLLSEKVFGNSIGKMMGFNPDMSGKGADGAGGFGVGVPQFEQQQLQQALLQGRNGLQQNSVDQQALAQQLMEQSRGGGPNPAQMMLNQATNKGIQQNAGMLASSKGMNPAMAARLAGQNAAGMNQQAAGQGALMQAQQQLAAQGQLGGLYNQIGQQNLNQQQVLQNALASQNQLGVQAQMHPGDIGSRVYAAGADANAKKQAGMMGGLGSALAMFGTMGGGAGGEAGGGGGMGGMDMAGGTELGGGGMMVAAHGARVPGKANVGGDSASNDTVHAMLSPGEIVVPRSKAQSPEDAKEFIDHLMSREGKKKRKGA